MGEERLLPPPTPSGMTLRAFGQRVMRWGTGDAAARARIPTLTREELERAGLTRDLAEAWRDFYHISTDLVVAQEASDVESSSRLDFLLLHNLGTSFVTP